MASVPQQKTRGGLFGNTIGAKETRLAWMLMLPTLIIVFTVVVFPAIFSIWISFADVTLSNLNDVFNADFVGLENYREVFNDYRFLPSGLNNLGVLLTSVLYSFLSTFLTMGMGLGAAMLLNRPFRARGIARGVFLFPYVAPVVSVAFVWVWLLDPRPSGVLNHVLMLLGIIDRPIAFLAQRGVALWLVILFQGWRYFPFAMLMILARLQAIDKALYEAADVDGANAWDKFRFVTLSELRYVLGAIFLLRLLWTFNKFDDIWLMTGGGYGTMVLPVLTYEFSFKSYNFGKGAAAAMILLVALVIFIFFYVRFVMSGEEAEG
jgi:multiple sugar transport system permease protein